MVVKTLHCIGRQSLFQNLLMYNIVCPFNFAKQFCKLCKLAKSKFIIQRRKCPLISNLQFIFLIVLYKKVSILFCKPQPSQDRPRHYAKLHFENNQSGNSRYFYFSSNTTKSIIQTMDTRRLFYAAQIQIPIPNKYLGCGYKGLFFVEIMVE